MKYNILLFVLGILSGGGLISYLGVEELSGRVLQAKYFLDIKLRQGCRPYPRIDEDIFIKEKYSNKMV